MVVLSKEPLIISTVVNFFIEALFIVSAPTAVKVIFFCMFKGAVLLHFASWLLVVGL